MYQLQCYYRINILVLNVIQYIYLFSLQGAAFVLAILTRKVKIKVLNDMMIIVYSSHFSSAGSAQLYNSYKADNHADN